MKPRQRHKARRLALQAVYQWQIAKTPITDLTKQFVEENDPHKIDLGYFQHLLNGIVKEVEALDEKIGTLSNRPLKQLDPIELAVLRMATYELQHELGTPYRVIINEALELNKTFGTEEGFKFVNAILDKIAKQLRSAETE